MSLYTMENPLKRYASGTAIYIPQHRKPKTKPKKKRGK